jgi:hypothetical protein
LQSNSPEKWAGGGVRKAGMSSMTDENVIPSEGKCVPYIFLNCTKNTELWPKVTLRHGGG